MTVEIEYAYEPAGETLRRFHCSDDFVRILMGPLGSAKTTACCAEIWRRACEQRPDNEGVRNSRWVVVRNTYPELETTTIASWRGMFGNVFGKFTMGHPPLHKLRVNLDDGTKVNLDVLFMAMDGPESIKKLLSLEVTGAYLNETKELPKAVLDMVTGRVGRYPSMAQGGPTWHGVICDTNLPDDDHWLYDLNENTPRGWQFFRQPGGVVLPPGSTNWLEAAPNPEAENVNNLIPGYYENMIGGKKPEWIKVYLGAEYGFAFDGKPVFPEFVDSLHVREFEISDADAGLGVDFGLTPAAVFGQRDVLGRWLIFDELTTDDMGAVAFAQLVGQRLRGDYRNLAFQGWGDPAGEQRSQVDERTPFQVMKAQEIPIRPAPTNDALLRREAVAGLLSKIVDGVPALLIHPRCKRLRKALAGGYNYRRVMVAGDERYRDVPDKSIYSHVAEALEYLLIGGGEGRAVVKRPQKMWAAEDDTAERMSSPFV